MDWKIAILSTVINKELYTKSSRLFPQNIQKYVIDGSNGMHGLDSIFYMMKKLKGKRIDWLIMADEDVLFQRPEMIFEIIKKMEFENYTVCGCRDGGNIAHRKYNPYIINTFFSIINFKEIEKIWDKYEIKKNQYINKNEFNDDLSNLSTDYDTLSIYEPYYCFYLWLRRNNKKFLFLDAKQPFLDDEITNAVYFENEILLFHTWYARSFGISDKHTIRINKIFEFLKYNNIHILEPKVFKQRSFFAIKKMKKVCQKIILKVKISCNFGNQRTK